MTTHVGTKQDSPDEEVGVGLLTKTGLGTALLMMILAGVDAIAGETIDSDTRLLIGTSVASVIATVLARAYQQGKIYAARRGITLPDRPLR